MKINKLPSRKRTKEQQSAITAARTKMKEKVVKSKKVYSRKSNQKISTD